MWPDNETTEDLLGFKVHADLLRSIVTNPDMLPITVGVFGDWGGGKTSIMKMLQRDLNSDNYSDEAEKEKYEHVACLYFNGWLFEGYEDAKAAIINTVLLQLAEHKRFGPRVRNKINDLLTSIDWMQAAKTGLKVGIPATIAYLNGDVTSLAAFRLPMFQGTEPGSEKDNDKDAKLTPTEAEKQMEEIGKLKKAPQVDKAKLYSVRTFRDEFSKLLKDSDIKTLVVLIDDLDRCSPERIIENLEAIKLFLNVESTAFIIGVDPRIVRHAIANRYRTYELGSGDTRDAKEQLVEDYLEKLIQIPYRLPYLSPSETETYMTLLFCIRELQDIDKRTKTLAAFKEHYENNRHAVFGFSAIEAALGKEHIPDGLKNGLSICARIAPLITEGLKGNPRQIKRFLNSFILRNELARIANLCDIRDEILVKLMVLEYGKPEAFKQLYEWQASQNGFPKEIKQFEGALAKGEQSSSQDDTKKTESAWNSTFIQKWLNMEPLLSGIDLRDYFWVARDRLDSKFAGLSMVPQIVRRIVGDLVSGSPVRLNQAKTSVKDLSSSELTTLYDLLVQFTQANPDKKKCFDALRALIEIDTAGAADILAKVLMSCPAEKIPAAVGMDIATLMQSKQETQSILQPVFEQLAQSDTQIARAIKAARKRGG